MIAAIFLSALTSAAASLQPPTEGQVNALEARYTPPTCCGGRVAGALRDYERWYWQDASEPGLVDGVALTPDVRFGAGATGRPGVHRVHSSGQAPIVMDGACSVVWIRYRPTDGRLTATCGGL